MNRRIFLKQLVRCTAFSTALIKASSVQAHDESLGLYNPFEQGVLNDCSHPLVKTAEVQQAIKEAWQGIDPSQVWDCHLHIVGIGDSPSGIRYTPDMDSWLHPAEKIRKWFYMHAACGNVKPKISVDQQIIERLVSLLQDFPAGAKGMLFAFDACYNEAGFRQLDKTAFYIPNHYASKIAYTYPERFEWVASIHPYRKDALEALEQAVKTGARAIKWLPAAMGIDPAHPLCLPFYHALIKYNLPLICHTGEEKAVHGANAQPYNNPLKLRIPLDKGVRVIAAHCASLGEALDLDAGKSAKAIPSFKLFERLMNHSHYKDRLFGDISAITASNRTPDIMRTLLLREDWHTRLLNGSDYPLPAVMPLFSPQRWVKAGLLEAKHLPVLYTVRKSNPLLFDFMLKRQLSWKGHRFSPQVFQTKSFFSS